MRLIRGIFCLSLLLVAAVSTHASEAPPVYGVVDWRPLGFQHQGEPEGLFTDILDLVDASLEQESERVLRPVSRLMREIQGGELDFTILYNAERVNRQVRPVLDVGCLNAMVVSRSATPVKTLADLNGLRVAFPPRGYFAEKFAPALNLEPFEVTKTDLMFRLALRNRVDAFVVTDIVFASFRRGLNPALQVPEERWSDFAPPLPIEPIRLTVSQSLQSPHQALGDRMAALHERPAFRAGLEALFDKYGLPGGLNCMTASGRALR